MTPEEKNMLTDFANRIAQMPAPARDAEAEELIRTKIGSRPDALYLMTQTVMVQNMALERAQQQIQELQNRTSQGQVSGSSSWLGQSQPGGYSQPPVSQAPQYAPSPQYAAPISGGFGGGGFGGGSFLRGAAQTAAGVAAGSLAAGAIESMFSHHGGGMFGGNEFVGSGGGMAPTEEVVNNYYDSPGDRGSDLQGGDSSNFVDSSNLDDSSSSPDDSSQFDDAGLDTDDSGGFDGGSDDNFS